MGDTDRWDSQEGPEVQGEPTAPWMITAGRVDDQHVGVWLEGPNGCCQQRPFAKSKESSLIGSRSRTMHHHSP